MNSKSIGTFLNQSGEDTGMIEIYEPNDEGDLELVMWDAKLKSLGSLYLSSANAYDLAVALIQAAGSKL